MIMMIMMALIESAALIMGVIMVSVLILAAESQPVITRMRIEIGMRIRFRIRSMMSAIIRMRRIEIVGDSTR